MVPGIDDRDFTWALATAYAPVPIRSLPTFRGWLVPVASELALWNAIQNTHGASIICPYCLHGELPCDVWMNIVTQRFEAAHAEMQRAALLQAANSIYGKYGESTRYFDQSTGYDIPRNDKEQRSSRNIRNQYRGSYEHPVYEYTRSTAKKSNSYDAKPKSPPKPPEPTREEKLKSAARQLAISWPATKDEVKKAFRKAALKAHPDLGGNDQAFIAATKARDTLMASV